MGYNLKKCRPERLRPVIPFQYHRNHVSLRKIPDIAVDEMEISPVARVSENLGCGASVASKVSRVPPLAAASLFV